MNNKELHICISISKGGMVFTDLDFFVENSPEGNKDAVEILKNTLKSYETKTV